MFLHSFIMDTADTVERNFNKDKALQRIFVEEETS